MATGPTAISSRVATTRSSSGGVELVHQELDVLGRVAHLALIDATAAQDLLEHVIELIVLLHLHQQAVAGGLSELEQQIVVRFQLEGALEGSGGGGCSSGRRGTPSTPSARRSFGLVVPGPDQRRAGTQHSSAKWWLHSPMRQRSTERPTASTSQPPSAPQWAGSEKSCQQRSARYESASFIGSNRPSTTHALTRGRVYDGPRMQVQVEKGPKG